MDELLAEAARSMKDWLAENRASLKLGKTSGERVYADAPLIQQALRELIENGVRFDPKRSGELSIWAELQDGQVQISIQDRGPGIAPAGAAFAISCHKLPICSRIFSA